MMFCGGTSAYFSYAIVCVECMLHPHVSCTQVHLQPFIHPFTYRSTYMSEVFVEAHAFTYMMKHEFSELMDHIYKRTNDVSMHIYVMGIVCGFVYA